VGASHKAASRRCAGSSPRRPSAGARVRVPARAFRRRGRRERLSARRRHDARIAMTIACVDVDYRERKAARAACVLIDAWESSEPLTWYAEAADVIPHAYEPGFFYPRELPYLMAVLRLLPALPGVIVVDGYVWLPDGRPGLGAHLYEAPRDAPPSSGSRSVRSKVLAQATACCPSCAALRASRCSSPLAACRTPPRRRRYDPCLVAPVRPGTVDF
jgi:hypothetical protein